MEEKLNSILDQCWWFIYNYKIFFSDVFSIINLIWCTNLSRINSMLRTYMLKFIIYKNILMLRKDIEGRISNWIFDKWLILCILCIIWLFVF